jgi:hypothetical protein
MQKVGPREFSARMTPPPQTPIKWFNLRHQAPL